MENSEEIDIAKITSDHLLNISNHLASTCPAASRFYMFNRERYISGNPAMLKNKKKPLQSYCNHCGSIWFDKNYQVRVHARKTLNLHMKKLLQIEEKRPWELNKCQKKKLKKWRESVNKLVYKCKICFKKTVFNGNKKYQEACSFEEVNVTPASHKKKKNSLKNAGLFFSPLTNEMNTTEETKVPEKLPRNEVIEQNEVKTPLTTKHFNHSINKSKNSLKNHITPSKLKTCDQTTTIIQPQSSGKKKKKTLLAQILNQEQSNKKKTSLASFLVSL